jgi:hypothetical protein
MLNPRRLGMWLATVLLLACAAGVAHAQADRASCEALKSSTRFADVLDAPTSITSATFVDAKPGAPGYCALEGYVTPTVGFALWLPTEWNGKLLGRGCGGFCGIVAGDFACRDPVRIHYACVQTDMGHKSGLTDGVWAKHNLQGKFDFGVRSTHVSTVAAKAVMASYYGRPSDLNYFLGCSTGGRQGLMEAQRFPADYQGIVSVAPALNETGASIQLTWSLLANRADGRNILSPLKLAMIHAAVVAACDVNDGLKDGLIGDPRRCRFDPASLTCRGPDANSCLTPAEVGVVRKIYQGPPHTAGLPIFTGGALPGSEWHWDKGYIGQGSMFGPTVAIETDFWRYLGFPEDPGAGWTLDQFDFARDPARVGEMEALYNAGNPDLRAFKALGGKLIMAQGMADDNVVPGGTIDYYRGVQRFMGGEAATFDFARLFLVPGMLHCTSGEGAYAIDYLSALEGWREKAAPPSVLAGAHPRDGVEIPYLGVGLDLRPAQVAFRRPMFAYPAMAHYRAGDPDRTESWDAVPYPEANEGRIDDR